MERVFGWNFRCGSCTLSVAMFLASVLLASSASGLPIGYQEDFDGCREIKDEQKRKKCCTETWEDCQDECKRERLRTKDYDGHIRCATECNAALTDCKGGKSAEGVFYPPGHDALPDIGIPGLTTDANVLMPIEGASLGASVSSVMLEVQNPAATDTLDRCLTLKAECKCPEAVQEAAKLVCRPVVSDAGAECRMCPVGSGESRCESCKDCLMVLSGVRSCGNPIVVEEEPAEASDSPPEPKSPPEPAQGGGCSAVETKAVGLGWTALFLGTFVVARRRWKAPD